MPYIDFLFFVVIIPSNDNKTEQIYFKILCVNFQVVAALLISQPFNYARM